MPSLRKLSPHLRGALILLSLFILLEIVLRLAPVLVSIPLLVRFHPELRLEVAERRNLPNFANRRDIIDTKGNVFRIYRPNVTVSDVTGGLVSSVTMDGEGFCNPAGDSYDKESIDVITVGDSINWCTTIEPKDTWTHLLGQKRNVSIYNLSTPGIGPYESLDLVEQFAIKKSPRVVVLALYEGNDLRDANGYASTPARTGKNVTTTPPCGLPDFLCSIYRGVKESPVGKKSYGVNLFVASGKYIRDWAKTHLAGTPEEISSFTDFGFIVETPTGRHILFNRESHDLDEPRNAERAQGGSAPFDNYLGALDRFAELGTKHHFTPVLLYVPSAHNAYQPYRTFRDESLEPVLEWFSENQRAFLEQESDKRKITFLDLTTYLQEKSNAHRGIDTLLYFQENLHLTPVGHETVAAFLDSSLHTLLQK